MQWSDGVTGTSFPPRNTRSIEQKRGGRKEWNHEQTLTECRADGEAVVPPFSQRLHKGCLSRLFYRVRGVPLSTSFGPGHGDSPGGCYFISGDLFWCEICQVGHGRLSRFSQKNVFLCISGAVDWQIHRACPYLISMNRRVHHQERIRNVLFIATTI